MRKKIASLCLSLLIAVSGLFAVSQTPFVAKRSVSNCTPSAVINKNVSQSKSNQRVPRHRTPQLLNSTTNAGVASLTQSKRELPHIGNPMKVSPSGAMLYGFLAYPATGENLWTMDEIKSDGSTPEPLYEMTSYLGAGAVRDGKLIAYSQEFFWDMVSEFGFGEYDLVTGERLSYTVLSIEDISNAIMTMAYDPTTNLAYVYTYSTDGESFQFCSVDLNNPGIKTPIKENLKNEDVAISFTYSPKDGKFYGVNVQGIFAEIDVATGEMTEVIDTGTDLAGYVTGLCYSYKDDCFIWNANLSDDSSALYAIKLDDKSCRKLTDYSNMAQYNFIVTTDEVGNTESPKKATLETISFEKGNLNGFITFEMPDKTYSETPITEELNYHAYVDGILNAEGTAVAGELVTVNYSTLTQGNHVFSFIVSDSNGLESPTLLATIYVGFDNPKAPTNVKFDNNGISWDAVTDETGKNGGYVDLSDLSYEVYVDGQKITDTTATFVNYTIDGNDVSTHYAEVIAVSNDMKSLPGVSNKFISGDSFSLPLLIEPTEEELDLCTIIDRNNDGFTWRPRFIDTYFTFTYSFSAYNDADDWIILPPFHCESDEFSYQISVESAVSITGYPESYEIYYGNSAEPEDMIKLYKKENIDNTSWVADKVLFSVPEAGTYYAAIRCVSPADRFDLRIRNIKIEQTTISTNSPAEPTDIEAVPADRGEYKATVSFNMPTMSLKGDLLDADTDLEAVVESAVELQKVIGKPGSRQSVEITTEQGNNQIGISVSDGVNISPIAYVNVYTGFDIPASPENFKGELSEDNMTIHLSWDAPTEGYNGGYVLPNGEGMTYNIVLYNDFSGWYVEPSIEAFSETSYDFAVPEEYGLLDLAIGVVASNQAGQGISFAYGSFIAGKPYELPMFDDFTSGDFIYNPLTTWLEESSAVNWTAFNPIQLGEKYANRTGIALIGQAYTDNSHARLSLPKFSTENTTNPYVSLYLYCGSAIVDIYAEAYGMEPTKIASATDINTVGWADLTVKLPDEFIGKKWVTIYLDALFPTTNQYVLFGGYSIKNYLANDMAITSVNVPKEVKIGNPFTLNVQVENYGYEDAEFPEVKVELFKNGKLVETRNPETSPETLIGIGEKLNFEYEFDATTDMLGEIEVVASLIKSDMDNSNNSQSNSISIIKGNALVVTDLKARLDNDGNVELYWTEPEVKSGHESFEDYPVWSYGSTIGEFTCIDGDGYHQYIIDGLSIPDANLPKAFQVYDISSFGETYADIFPASDGRQYIAAFCPYEPEGNIAAANDWLISPELKPGSEFSFEMNIFTAGYGAEIVEILTSNASDKVEDFILLETVKKGETGWETFSFTLSQDAKYLAIRYVSKDVFGIMIDNINYTNVYGEASISGYDIYRNNEMIAENASVHGLFTDMTVTEQNADYAYNIVPILNNKHGLLSNTASINPSAIENILLENMIYGAKREIIINGFANQRVNIFSVDGKLITSVLNDNDNIRISIQPGIYIVNADKHSVKVFVR